MFFMQNGMKTPNEALAGSYDFMHLFGHVCLGYMWAKRCMKNPNEALAGSYDFMHLFGHVCLGYMWARMGVAAKAALADGAEDRDFYESKLATGRYYMARRLPACAMHVARITSGAESVMALDATNF